MSLNPDISVVILNYNGFEETRQLLESLLPRIGKNTEVIVVDNGSLNDEASLIEGRFKEIKVVPAGKNLGFAAGNNLGMSISKGRYILLLNNDTLVRDDSIDRMAGFMEHHPIAGALSPRLHYDDDAGTLQYAGYTPLSKITLRNRTIGMGSKDASLFITPSLTPYTHGAAMMLKREVFEKTGGMDERFFLYYEEFDWCERIRKAGYQIWFFPQASIVHKESRSTGRDSALRKYYMTRNRLLFASKHRTGPVRAAAILYQLAAAAPVAMIRAAAEKRGDLVFAIFAGISDFCRKRFGKWERI